MTEDELNELIRSGENIPIVARYLTENPALLPHLLKLAESEENFAWRALWIADKIHEQHAELIVPFLPEMTEMVQMTTDKAKKRHLLKLISLNKIPEEKMGEMLNFCVDRFADASEPVAVRVHAMQVLFNIALEQPDFAGELIELIEHELEFHGSAGIISRGRKLLQRLRTITDNHTE